MTAKKSPVNFETAIIRLEEITELLEAGDLPLEKSIELYTEGLELAKQCQTRLTEAEQKIKIVREKSGVLVEEDFDDPRITQEDDDE